MVQHTCPGTPADRQNSPIHVHTCQILQSCCVSVCVCGEGRVEGRGGGNWPNRHPQKLHLCRLSGFTQHLQEEASLLLWKPLHINTTYLFPGQKVDTGQCSLQPRSSWGEREWQAQQSLLNYTWGSLWTSACAWQQWHIPAPTWHGCGLPGPRPSRRDEQCQAGGWRPHTHPARRTVAPPLL